MESEWTGSIDHLPHQHRPHHHDRLRLHRTELDEAGNNVSVQYRKCTIQQRPDTHDYIEIRIIARPSPVQHATKVYSSILDSAPESVLASFLAISALVCEFVPGRPATLGALVP